VGDDHREALLRCLYRVREKPPAIGSPPSFLVEG
jgi:hypothetical protein